MVKNHDFRDNIIPIIPGESTVNAKRMKVNIWQNIEGEFELNQNTIRLCRLPKECISRMDLGIILELSENAQRGRSIDEKVICACNH